MKTIALMLLVSCLSLFGAGKKFTDYPPITNAGPNDLLLLSEFTGSATNSKSLSITNLNNSLLSLSRNGPYVVTNNGAAEWLHIYYGLVFDTVSSADVFSSAGGDPWSFRAQTGTSVVARLGVMTNAINTAVAGRILSDTGSGTNTTLSKGIIFDYLTFGSGIYFTNTVDGKKWTFTGAGTNDVATLGQLTNLVQAATNGLSAGGGGDGLTNIAGANINISTNGFYRVFTATNTYQSGLFGDGSDGHLIFDGTTTVLGIVPVGNIYTLTKTLYASGISNGATIRVNAFRVFCSGIITNAGSILAVSNAGGNGAANGTNGTAGVVIGGSDIAGSVVGAIGGLGSATTGGNGAIGANSIPSSGGAGSKGGTGGSGLAGANAGGISAAAGTLFFRPLRTAPANLLQVGLLFSSGGSSGSGGGAGGGDGVVFGAGGGGSGAGGGVVGIWAWGISNLAGATISVNGGNGGNGGSPASGNAGGGAGGGGGGGGFVYANYAYSSGAGTWTATGGLGGSGGVGQGTGSNGAPGTNGAAGLIIRYNVTTRLFE